MPRIFTSRRIIAVTGLQNSGKTVFITSMINHLKEYQTSGDDFDLGDSLSGASFSLGFRFGPS